MVRMGYGRVATVNLWFHRRQIFMWGSMQHLAVGIVDRNLRPIVATEI